MSQEERKIADMQGRFLRADEIEEVDAEDWISGRVLLSNQRMILAWASEQSTLPLATIQSIRHSPDVESPVGPVSTYTYIELEEGILLVSTADQRSFEDALTGAVLEGAVVSIREGRAEDAADPDWRSAQIAKCSEGRLTLHRSEADPLHINLDDSSALESNEQTIGGEPRLVIEVTHAATDSGTRTVIAASPKIGSHLRSILSGDREQSDDRPDLDEREREVLSALYSGISPFAVPEFTGLTVDEVEAAYKRLIEADVLNEVRRRREVSLTSRGRNLASEAIGGE